MKVCGIELKGSDAIVVCLDGNAEKASQILLETRKIGIKDSSNQEEIKLFKERMADFLSSNDFDKVGIKSRATKGRFAGGSVSFKMEGIIQCMEVNVALVHGASIKAGIKNMGITINSEDVKAYQGEAFLLAQYLLNS